MSKESAELATFHMEVTHLHALIKKHRTHVTAEGIELALAALLNNPKAKAEAVLITSHPDFPPLK